MKHVRKIALAACAFSSAALLSFAWSEQSGLSLSVVLEMDSLTNIKSLVARGSCYTILPHAAVFDEVHRGTLVMVPIRDPVIRRTVFLVRNPSKPGTQAAREIERLIVEIVAELVRKKLWLAELPADP